jgi:hypothetical protein
MKLGGILYRCEQSKTICTDVNKARKFVPIRSKESPTESINILAARKEKENCSGLSAVHFSKKNQFSPTRH